jgi:hypothetical protein
MTQPELGPDGEPLVAGDDLTSVAEAEQLIADRNEDWDVSEAGGDESRAKLESFIVRRNQENQERVSLSGMTRSEGAAGASRREKKGSGGGANATLLSTFLGAAPTRSAPRSARLSRPSADGADGGPKKLRGKGSKSPAPDDGLVEELIELPPELRPAVRSGRSASITGGAPLVPSPESIAKLVTKAQSWKWARSPLAPDAVPAPVAVILAIFENMELFGTGRYEMIVYQSIVSDFVRGFKPDTMVMDAGNFDNFVVLLYLLKCVKDPRIDQAMAAYFVEALAPAVGTELDEWVRGFLRELGPLAESILDTIIDGDAACAQLADKVKSAFRPFSLPAPLEKLCQQRLLKMLDSRLVSMITEESARCTFGHAGEWNTVITILRTDTRFPIELDLFREAASVLMMGAAMCGEPALANDLAPSLPPAHVLRLLASQKPDDFNPMPNDVAAFANFYHLDPKSVPDPIPIAQAVELGPVLEVISGDWKSVQVDPQTAARFDFLSEHLKVNE